MKKILMICLYPIAALLVVFAFLHFSYIIKYDNVDGFIIGMILLFFFHCYMYYICLYFSSKKKNYGIFYLLFLLWLGLYY